MSEGSEVVRPMLDALRAAGIFAWRQQSGLVKVRGAWMHLAPEGTPDIVGYLDGGRMLAVECKLGKGPTRDAQTRWAAAARARGVLVLECRDAAQVVPTVQALLLAQGQRWCG